MNTFFICLFVCFIDSNITVSLYNCLLEVSVDDILLQAYNIAHIGLILYSDTEQIIDTNTHTYTFIFFVNLVEV